MTRRKIEIDLPAATWTRIDRLAAHLPKDAVRTPLESFVADLLDHAQQGVYRSGSWERDWLLQCVGEEPVNSAYALEEDPL